MRVIFIGYKGGRHTQHSKYALIKVDGVDDKRGTGKYIGRKVIWTSPKGSHLIGKIIGSHGRKGTLKAKFRKGLPGQAIGTELKID
jgi:large subunit ribosomal protein L35Ae